MQAVLVKKPTALQINSIVFVSTTHVKTTVLKMLNNIVLT